MTAIAPPALENTIIRASAGSGKTTELTQRYLRLLASGVHCQSILASTFTRKAAGEILDRVITSLASVALGSPDARQIVERLQLDELDDRKAQSMLRHVLTNMHRLQIGTLDSFFAKLARSFCLEMGLPPDWDIAESRETNQLMQSAVGAVLSRDDSIQLLHLMAKGQSFRGANKLMLDTVDDLYQIFLDSTDAAWFQLQQQSILSPERWLAALDALSAVAIDGGRMATARNDDVRRAGAEDWEEFIGTGLVAKILEGTNAYYKVPIPDALQAAYRPLIEHVRGTVINELRESTEATHGLLARFHEFFDVAKAEAGSLDFDDVTRRLVELLDGNGGEFATAMTHRLDWNLDHLLLDEFQDTSPAQWHVIEPFARRVMEPGTPGSFFCVGDMKQAIYGWRGGVAEVFDVVEQQFPDLRDRELTCSHRSSQIIIDALNRVFENTDRYQSNNDQTNEVVRRWRQRFTTHTTDRDSLPGYAVLEKVAAGEETLVVAVGRVKEIYQNAPGRSIAVLTRENTEVAELIFALQAAGVPASEEGGNPLTDSVSVLLILSLMRLSDHPQDSLAWFHVANSPLAEAFGLPPCPGKRAQTLEAVGRVHASAAEIRRALSERGYGFTIARCAKILAPQCTLRELRRLQKLIELADEYDAQATLRSSDFVEYVRTTKVEDRTASPVRVMTIHKAKGLEFDVVVLPCVSKTFNARTRDVLIYRNSPTERISLVVRHAGAAKRRLLPEQWAQAHQQQIDRTLSESICVLYVAMTRAKHALHIILDSKAGDHHQSMAGILLATLPDDGQRTGTLYERGDLAWATRAHANESIQPPTKQTAQGASYRGRNAAPLVLAPPDQNWTRNLPTISPSEIASSTESTIGSALSQATNRLAKERGTMLHACLAEVDWLDEASWQGQLLNRLRRQFPRERNLEAIVADFSKMVQQPRLAALLHRASYLSHMAKKAIPNQLVFDAITASVERERSFAVRIDESIVRGSIDRLILIHEGESLIAAEVIEFKTDQWAGLNVEQSDARIGAYQPQIAAYRRAVARMTGLPPDRVFARLVLVGIDREFEVR